MWLRTTPMTNDSLDLIRYEGVLGLGVDRHTTGLDGFPRCDFGDGLVKLISPLVFRLHPLDPYRAVVVEGLETDYRRLTNTEFLVRVRDVNTSAPEK